MKKITKREMYEALINFANTGNLVYGSGENETEVTMEELCAFAENETALLDKKAEKAKETAAKKKAENDTLTDMVREALSEEEFLTIADVAEKIEGEDVTVSKVSYRLTQLVKNGEAEKQQITIAGGEGQKSRKIMAYRILAK